MEHIYLKGFPREWHTSKINLERYFKNYSEAYTTIVNKNNGSLKNIFNSLCPDIRLSQSEFRQLEHMTRPKQFKLFDLKINDKKQLKKVTYCTTPLKNKNINRRSKVKKTTTKPLNQELSPAINATDGEVDSLLSSEIREILEENIKKVEDNEITENIQNNKQYNNKANRDKENNHNSDEIFLNAFNFQGVEKLSKYKNSMFSNKRELLVNSLKHGKTNLERGRHFVTSFRIYEPFTHYEDKKIENFMQEIIVLDYQTLDFLRDKIICQSDFQDVQGDLSEKPDTPVVKVSKEVYNSAMFYFDNTFYVDLRYQGSIDYSSVIKEWAKCRGIFVGNTYDMRMMPVGCLRIRFGYPYLYVHQGCCEHLVIINDARLLTGKESLSSYDFPMITRIPRHVTQSCMICSSQAWWIVVNSDRLFHATTYLCKICFKQYNYVDGQKCGQFTAYRYNPKSALL